MNKLEAQWAESVSLTFHSALRKLNTEPPIAASHQILVIWLNSYKEEDIQKSTNQKQEWHVAAMFIGKNTQSKNISFNLNGNIIKTEDEVKLLGVTIDYELIFNCHITNICRKSSRQLNVLKRIGKYLNRFGKLTIYITHLFYQTLTAQ